MADRASEILKTVDWERYEEEAFLAAEDAVRHYNGGAKGSTLQALTQIAVWTSPQSRVTTIGFETLSHAISLASFVINRPEEGAPEVELTTYVDPADFELREYHCVYHPALLPLAELQFSRPGEEQAALSAIEKHLLPVRDRVVLADLLGRLPRAKTFWIGVNSPRGWYDHVLRL